MLPCTLQVARIKNRSKSDALQFEEYKVEEQAVATSSTEISREEWSSSGRKYYPKTDS